MSRSWARSRFGIALLVLTVLPGTGSVLTESADRSEAAGTAAPKKSGLVERAGTRLVQLDVTVLGDEKKVAALTREDFEVRVNLDRIEEFTVDRACRVDEAAASAAIPATPASAGPRASPESASAPGSRPMPVSYVLFFDQSHLTMAGRQRALDIARDVLPSLLAGGNRAMIVSSADGLATIEPFTSDLKRLLAGLDRLEADRSQWDIWASQEGMRVREIQEKLNTVGIERGVSLARIYAAEEAWRAERDLRRLSMVIGLLSEVSPPKAVLHFSDSLRKNPGEHYLEMFGSSTRGDASPLEAMGFHDVLREAAANGIRFYPVQAEGMVAASSGRGVSDEAHGALMTTPPSLVGVKHAQGTLTGMALETGGQAFLNGVRAEKIAERIVSDLECLYLISFDPVGLPEDEFVPVSVKIKRPGLKAQVRGRIVIPSESTRLTSRLLSAFATPEARSGMPVRAAIIPIGFDRGDFLGLVQVAVRGGLPSGATWDLGASLVSRGKVREDAAGRLTVSGPGAPIILEQEMRFAPGPYEIIAVAHEVTTDQVASSRLEGAWADPDAETAVIGPIAILQQVSGAFLRGRQAQASGALAQAENDPVRTDLPLAIVTLVCRSRGEKGPLRAARRLEGDSEAEFPAMEIEFGPERCAQVRDLVPPDTMTEGFFRYEIRVYKGNVEIAGAERTFPAVKPGA